MVIVHAARCCIVIAMIIGSSLIVSCDSGDASAAGAQHGTQDTKQRKRGPFDGLLHEGVCPADAGATIACLEGCLELCNAIDDDCDGKVDEVAANASCVAAYAESACVDGECQIVSCSPGHRNCNGQVGDGCELVVEDGQGCPRALCPPGYGDCDADGASCESRLDTPDHCGDCDVRCVSPPHADVQCLRGKCGPMTCLTGYADCDGDAENGCEQRLDSLQHCGECGRVCTKAACEGGVCSSVDCHDSGGFADCDGDEVDCETNLQSDLTHCGGCGNACQMTNPDGRARADCMEGRCTAICDAGYGDCDRDYANGCETRLGTIDHCGACGDTCALANVAEHSCTSGACVIRSCRANFADCDGNPANGCERDLRSPQNGGMGPCSPDVRCERLSMNASEYFVCPTPRSWQDARAHCQQQRNGDLAHVPDAATQELIRRQLSGRSWIGHTDVRIEGLWVWAYNQRPFWRDSPMRAPVDGQFAEWSPGEPNGSGDCGAMYETGLLDDLTCTRAEPFVCETLVDGCPEDPYKLDPGQCGCGQADVDADRDGFAECGDN